MALSAKQRKFAEAYTGNATVAARVAGYAGDDASLATAGYRLLRNVEVRKLIAERDEGVFKALVLNRRELQTMWSRMAADETLEPAARLKASELLGRSRAEFTDKTEVKVTGTFAETLKKARERAQQR